MRVAQPAFRSILPLLLTLGTSATLPAQTIEDGELLPRRALRAGVFYTHESWTEYWEGSLKRDNGNIGTLTMQGITWVAAYGVTDRLSVVGMLPYLWTRASQGPLHGMHGLQDVTVGAKYRLLEQPVSGRGSLRAIVVAAGGIPASDYTPDFLPLSIGLGSRRLSGRFTINFEADAGWFLNGSAAYTWRGKVILDRPAYYTDGQLYLSDEVAMPAVFDYTVGGGYRRGRFHIPISVSHQLTLGGGDIRRQDMPFVSNRMNFVRVDGAVMYALPAPKDFALRVGGGRILTGRNVGQSTTLFGGLLYTFHF